MTTDPIAAARAMIAAQPALLFPCDLCPDECNCHPHHDMSMSGEYILCDSCEDFDNPKGVPDPLQLIATLADALEAERAEVQHLRDTLHSAQAALNPVSGLLKKGAAPTRRYAEEVREKIRSALRRTGAGHG